MFRAFAAFSIKALSLPKSMCVRVVFLLILLGIYKSSFLALNPIDCIVHYCYGMVKNDFNTGSEAGETKPMRPTARIDNPLLTGWPDGQARVTGRVYDDIKQRFNDGAIIITSPIIMVDDGVIVTKNSFYEIGLKP